MFGKFHPSPLRVVGFIESMDLSIIILNYKCKELTLENVQSIERAHPRLKMELIIIDNHSKDGSFEFLRKEFSHHTVLEAERNGGFAYGNNVGMKRAKGKYVLIANPDTTYQAGDLEQMVGYMEEHPNVGILGPQLRNKDGSLQWSCMRFPNFLTPIFRRTRLGLFAFGQTELKRFLMKDVDHEKIQPVDWMIGACLMVRKKALDRVGLLDERYFMYVEDTDWCRRFWKKGYKVIYFPKVRITHHHKRASAGHHGFKSVLDYPTRIHLRSWWLYLKKYRLKKFEPTHYL